MYFLIHIYVYTLYRRSYVLNMIYMYIYSTCTFLYTYMYTCYIESHMYYKYDIHVHI